MAKKPIFTEAEYILLETNIDDMTGEQLGYITGLLMESGALDTCLIPIVAKKGRPGVILQVSCHEKDKDLLLEIIFKETSTLGVRETHGVRHELERKKISVKTPYGAINTRVGWNEDKMILKAKPEYNDASKAAKAHKVPLTEVQDEIAHCLKKKKE